MMRVAALRAIVALSALVVLAACWRSAPAPAPAPPAPVVVRPQPDARPPRLIDTLIDRMSEFADRICACTDGACVRAISDDMTKWAQDMANQDALKIDDDAQGQLQVIGMRMGDCM